MAPNYAAYDSLSILTSRYFQCRRIFYQCLPNKRFHLKNEKCIGGNHSKVRLSGMTAGNVKGERLPMFVIGKALTPSFNDAMDAITLLENYSLFTKFGVDLMKALEDINCVVDIDSQSNKRQSIITDFFA